MNDRILHLHRGLIFVCIICLWMGSSAVAEDDRWVTLSTVKSRPLSMGGAFISLRDDLAALDLNPAGFSILTAHKKPQVFLFLNPVSPLSIFHGAGKQSFMESVFGLLIRGAALSVGGVQFGCLLGEESLTNVDRLERQCIFDRTGLHANRNTTIGISVALAPRVSLGFAGEVYSRGEGSERIHRMGYRYGLILQTRHRIQVGLCFVNMPEKAENERMDLERLADETLNIGISYTPWDVFRVALDIRNVSDEGKGVVREPHIGIECFPLRHLVLRAGYFMEKSSKRRTYSAGLGLFDQNTFWKRERRFLHPSFCLNATVLWENSGAISNRWIFITGLFRI